MRPTTKLGLERIAILVAFVLSGCAGRSEIVSVPEAASDLAVVTQGPQVLPRMPWIALEDSAADEQALQALHELEFRSLGKDQVRGVVPAVGLDPTSTRGGTASGPVSSLNIEEFAGRDRVRYYVDFFLDPSRARFNVWLGRLARYDGMIRNVLRRYNLPEDLIYLALIESGYSNTAVSRASAVGMWQFIRSTGREYGLRIDGWVDERRDPFLATDAAARHLSDLQNEFNSWYLAAAAYNGGATLVSRGLRRLNEDAVSDSTFFVLADKRWIHRETRDYVPKLIAATMVAKDPLRYGLHSIPALEPLVFDEITVSDQTGLDVIASLADTTVGAIRELNPQYYRGATPPGEQATVRVPRGSGNRVAQEYAQLPPSERVNFLEHTVRRGETMGEIAQRYGVGLSRLKMANPRVRPRRMRIGQRLVIPMNGAARSARSRRARPVARAAVPPSGRHTVRWGDTLWILSQRYGVALPDLRRWNDIPYGAHDIKVGQRLRVRR